MENLLDGTQSPSANDKCSSPMIRSPPTMKPPLSVIVFHHHDEAESSCPTFRVPAFNPTQGSPASRSSFRSSSELSGTPPAGPSAFRLQPRTSFTTVSGPMTGARGRKRNANSITYGSPPRDAPNSSSSDQGSPSVGNSSPRTDAATLFLQGLSLQSPTRISGKPTTSLAFSPLSPSSAKRLATASRKHDGSSESYVSGASRSSIGSKRAPLKVLSQGESKPERPPLHGTPSSFFNPLGDDRTAFETPDCVSADVQYMSPLAACSVGGTVEAAATHTPLPAISLTPRSAMSSFTRKSTLPLFPSPGELSSPSSSMKLPASKDSNHYGSPTIEDFETPRPKENTEELKNENSVEEEEPGNISNDSLLPFPNWDGVDNPEIFPNCQSVFGAPLPGDSLKLLFEECGDGGSDSLSDSDSEAEFLLAPPEAIEDEKVGLVGGKKRCSIRSQSKKQSTCSLESTLWQSSTSLRGMDFLPSYSNLLAMSRQSSSRNLDRVESQSSIGLMLDKITQVLPSSTSGRDLLTPPAVGGLRTPPRISPHYYTHCERDNDHGLFIEDSH